MQEGALGFGAVVAVMVVVLLGIWVFVLVAYLMAAQRRKAGTGRWAEVWKGSATALVTVPVSPTVARDIAARAIRMAGGRDLVVRDRVSWGWVGSNVTNIPRYALFQLGVVLSVASEGVTECLCCSRPGSWGQMFGARRSAELARLLADLVVEAAKGPP